MPFSRSALTVHWRELHSADSILELARDASNMIYIKEKTSAETAIILKRIAASYYQGTKNIGVPIATKTANATAGGADCVVLVDASSGAITITLMAIAATKGHIFTIKKIDSSANAVTIDGNAAETIDGQLTRTLNNQYDALTIVGDGSAWYII